MRLRQPVGTGLGKALRIPGDVFLLLLDLRSLALRILDVSFAACSLVAGQLTLRFTQPVDGRRRLSGRGRITLRRGALHRIGRAAELPRGFGQVLAILIARQFLELARRLLSLFGQRALQVTAGVAG